MTDYVVRVSPLIQFPEQEGLGKFFAAEGFHINEIRLYADEFYLTFFTRREADEFVHAFDGARVRGSLLTAETVRHVPDEALRELGRTRSPEDREKIRSRTVAVRGYPPSYLNDRTLYSDFYPLGYLKQIEINRGVGYLQFDTEDDAENAVNKNDGMRIEGSRVTVELIPDRALNVPNLLVPLQIVEKEERREYRGGARWKDELAEGDPY
jgi:hypothetical protein